MLLKQSLLTENITAALPSLSITNTSYMLLLASLDILLPLPLIKLLSAYLIIILLFPTVFISERSDCSIIYPVSVILDVLLHLIDVSLSISLTAIGVQMTLEVIESKFWGIAAQVGPQSVW